MTKRPRRKRIGEQPVRKFGWKKEPKDERDLKYKVTVYEELPTYVDLRDKCPPVFDQGGIGSCTANALASAYQFEEMKMGKENFTPSRLFIYYNERALEGTIDEDAGAYIRDGIKTMVKEGVCAETMWPYIEEKFKDKPTEDCYKAAVDNQVLKYLRISPHTVYEVKHCLAEGFPVVFGFMVYDSFMTKEVAKTGIAPIPKENEQPSGGHAIMAVGYDDEKKYFIIRNSWGPDWGECFTGDTEIKLLSGEVKTLKELTESYQDEQFWVYSYDVESKEIVPGLAHSPRKTKTSTEVIKLILDSGDEIKCTPNHLFLLKDGTYKEANNLTTTDSLMPLYIKHDKDGYEMFLSPKSTRYIRTHWAVARNSEKFKGKSGKLVIHHMDFNKLNNSPENLAVMSPKEHYEYHRELGKINGSKILKKLWEERGEYMLENSLKQLDIYNENLRLGNVTLTDKQIEARKNNCKSVGLSYQRMLREGEIELSTKQIAARVKSGKRIGALPKTEVQRLQAKQMCSLLAKYRWYKKKEDSPMDFTEWKSVYNHKIISIENVGYEDVYDITVDKYHNFALNSGVFVHNCGYFYMPYWFVETPDIASDFWTIRLVE